MFIFAELTEFMQQTENKNTLNKVCVVNVDSEVERTLKPRIICNSNLHYPKHALHLFAENVPVFNPKKFMVNQINVILMNIHSSDSIAIGCRFSDGQIMAAANRSLSQLDNLSKTTTLKLELKICSSRILI